MISRLAAASRESFKLLVRNRIFVPALLIGLIVFSLTNLSSNWGNTEYYEILFGFSSFFFMMLGSLIAIFWAAQIVRSGDGSASLEIPLASSLGRGEFLLSRYLGLVAALFLIALAYLAMIQLNMLINSYGWFRPVQLKIFGLLTMVWFSMAAVTICLRTMCSQNVTTLVAFALFVVGLISRFIGDSLAGESSVVQKQVFSALSTIWDLQRFNLSEHLVSSTLPPDAGLAWHLAYGVAVNVLVLGFAWHVFRRSDL